MIGTTEPQGFLYWMPDRREKLTAVDIHALGYLDHAFDQSVVCAKTPGPDEKAEGMLFADPSRVHIANLEYAPAHQDWRQMVGRDVWIGHYIDRKPTPAVLGRKFQMAGYAVTIDGEAWVVPRARESRGEDAGLYPSLPRETIVDEDGKITKGGISRKWRWLWDITLKWLDCVIESNTLEDDGNDERLVTFGDYDEACRAAASALSVNYAVEIDECLILGLLDEDRAAWILNALADLPFCREMLVEQGKKLVAGGTSS